MSSQFSMEPLKADERLIPIDWGEYPELQRFVRRDTLVTSGPDQETGAYSGEVSLAVPKAGGLDAELIEKGLEWHSGEAPGCRFFEQHCRVHETEGGLDIRVSWRGGWDI